MRIDPRLARVVERATLCGTAKAEIVARKRRFGVGG
jgi:hypothetical protein